MTLITNWGLVKVRLYNIPVLFRTVYLSWRLNDKKLVIIKQIPLEYLRNKEERQAALNEVKVLSMLDHPNIIEYYENFLEDKALMIVMEYAEGRITHWVTHQHTHTHTQTNAHRTHTSGGSRISPQVEASTFQGASTHDFAEFLSKLHEIQRIWTPRGGSGRGPCAPCPLDPPTHTQIHTVDIEF